MTDISLVVPSSPFLINQTTFPPLGILYLSSSLKNKGFKVNCVDLGLAYSPSAATAKIVGISFTSPQRDQAYKLAKDYKAAGKITIAGGPHATHKSKECIKNGFDYVIKGEADDALPSFLEILNNSFSNIIFPIIDAVEPQNINRILYPDRTALPIHQYHYELNGKPATVIMTSRGCPVKHPCSFCSKITKKFRMQSSERTAHEILHINDKFGFEAFMIYDDVFTINKKRLKGLVDLLPRNKFIFRCFSRSDIIDEEVCELLQQLGVVEVGIGIESGSDKILKMNMKNSDKEKNTQSIRLLRDHGIRSKAFLIVGLPGETEETVAETEEWIKEAKPFDLDISIFQPLPGSSIFNDPDSYGISFSYETSYFFKGIPGKYTSVVKDTISSERLVELREYLEDKYKNKDYLR